MEMDLYQFLNQCSMKVRKFLLDGFKIYNNFLLNNEKYVNNTNFCLKRSLLLSSMLNINLLKENLYPQETLTSILDFFNISRSMIPDSIENNMGYKPYLIFINSKDEFMPLADKPEELSVEYILYNVLKDKDIRKLIESLEIEDIPESNYNDILKKVEKNAFINETKAISKPNSNKNSSKPNIQNNRSSNVKKHLKNLEEYGIWLTNGVFKYNPAIGREEELKTLKINLLKRKSIILIGDAGVGKTAIVKGLAYDIIIGNVPDF